MDLSDKIKLLRRERGMTLEAVGDIVGVGKSTVRKWESGQIANMKRDKIALIAKALNVTPAYLMGWDEGSTDESDAIDEKNEFESMFNSLSEENQKRIIDLMKALSSTQQ